MHLDISLTIRHSALPITIPQLFHGAYHHHASTFEARSLEENEGGNITCARPIPNLARLAIFTPDIRRKSDVSSSRRRILKHCLFEYFLLGT